MTKKSLLDSKLYITEAAESKKKAKDELEKADPADCNIEKLIAAHGTTKQCDGTAGDSNNR